MRRAWELHANTTGRHSTTTIAVPIASLSCQSNCFATREKIRRGVDLRDKPDLEPQPVRTSTATVRGLFSLRVHAETEAPSILLTALMKSNTPASKR